MTRRTRTEIEDELRLANARVRRLKAEWSTIQPGTLEVKSTVCKQALTLSACGRVVIFRDGNTLCHEYDAAPIAAWFAYHFPNTEETS